MPFFREILSFGEKHVAYVHLCWYLILGLIFVVQTVLILLKREEKSIPESHFQI